MADKIRLLPEVVANQIAAGEVVNRPASVVKEMMENAIDAGATSVKVNFRDGGKDLIQIVDDGCGMSPIDARMAFDRHATSKIGAVEDIYALHTFGFRGEALASIAAVSQVELRTRQAGDEVGTQTEINGGQFAAQNPVRCPVGSQFFVRNLFYNVTTLVRAGERPYERAYYNMTNSWITWSGHGYPAPGFVDEANENWNLKPDAEVFKQIPGFKAIPFDKIGFTMPANTWKD